MLAFGALLATVIAGFFFGVKNCLYQLDRRRADGQPVAVVNLIFDMLNLLVLSISMIFSIWSLWNDVYAVLNVAAWATYIFGLLVCLYDFVHIDYPYLSAKSILPAASLLPVAYTIWAFWFYLKLPFQIFGWYLMIHWSFMFLNQAYVRAHVDDSAGGSRWS